MIDGLSERAPSIVVFTLCGALLAAWIDAPVWLPEAAAAVVGFLAILLFAARGRRGRFRDCEDEAEASGKSWLDYELAGKGTPPGYYVLAFFGIVTNRIDRLSLALRNARLGRVRTRHRLGHREQDLSVRGRSGRLASAFDPLFRLKMWGGVSVHKREYIRTHLTETWVRVLGCKAPCR